MGERMALYRSLLRYRAGELWRRLFGDRGALDVHGRGRRAARRALLVYLTEPFRLGEAGRELFAHHQIWWRNLEISRLLDERGFAVDVFAARGRPPRLSKDYDLLIGVGPVCRRLAEALPESVTKVYLATAAEPGFFNRQEADRLEDLARRRGCRLEPRRQVRFRGEELAPFHAVFVVGNRFTAETFAPYHDRVFPFDNVGHPGLEVPERDFAAARRHFLFFSSRGQVLKGLDRLLEAFGAAPDLHLHVAGTYERERDFVDCYRRELYELPNVHPHGWLRLRSPAFYEVVARCGSVVHPSAVEGQAGSVIDCMSTGLVPVVSRETGVDTDGVGVVLPSCEIEEIARVVRSVADRPAEWLEAESARTRDLARARFSHEAARRRLGELLDQVGAA